MTKSTMTSKCTSIAAHFEGLADAPEQYRWHHSMRHVQGYLGSHWMPPSGNYLLPITPVADRATGKQIPINKYTKKGGHVDGCGGAPVQYRAHHPMEEVQGFTRSHWMPPLDEYYVQKYKSDMATIVFFNVFIVKTVGKGHESTLRPLFLIGV
jgi:hypothetical protein